MAAASLILLRFSNEFDKFAALPCGLFLVRNWCGSSAIETWT